MEPKDALKSYLRKNKLMFLSTSSETGPWVTALFYALDDELNFYFMSASGTKHVLDIEKNNNVALAIASTDQQLYSQKSGVQIAGTAHKLAPKSEDFKEGLRLFLTEIWGYSEEKVLELETVKSMTGELFRVKPEVAMFMDEKLFNDHVSRKIVF